MRISAGLEVAMMLRVPDAGPDERERQQTIEHLRRQLRRFQRVPTARRESECANEAEDTCRALLRKLGVDPDDDR